jgi:hypothetical protein
VAAVSETEVRLLFDASDVDPGLERYRRVPRSIGEANRTGAGPWIGAPGAVLGADPPSSALGSVRDPAMLVDVPNTAWVAVDADGTDTFQIALTTRQPGEVPDWNQSPIPLAWDAVPDLDSMRSPAVARIGAGPYHLWFVGTSEAGMALYHAADGSLGDGSIGTAQPVLTTADVGARALRGISDPMVVVGNDVFHIWFFAEDALGRRTLYYGVAPASGESIELYEGNPVLDPQDPVLGSCDQGCSLRGGTVITDAGGRRTFLFARSAGSETPVQEIVTLTQPIGGPQ